MLKKLFQDCLAQLVEKRACILLKLHGLPSSSADYFIVLHTNTANRAPITGAVI